ncbi:MAG: response regulator [Pseudomonadales bacterium]|nr:response regulator [Pseudomonadales bacterium]
MDVLADLRVLIVDDEVKITELMSFALRHLSYEITTASSAAQALLVMEQEPINILVTDIRMPEMDGLELSREVMKRFSDIQIIIISAHGDVNSAVEALKFGAVDFLLKPVDPKVLQLSINSAAEKWRLRYELQVAYRQLEEEKEFLAVTLRSIGDGVIATDLDGRVTMINKLAVALTGWEVKDAVGTLLTDVFYIINEKTRMVCENPVAKVLETGRIIGLANHTALIAKNGAEISIADSAAPIRDSQNNVIGTVLVFRDVTVENKANAELAKTKKLESVGVLAGGIAHDFNNILTGIMANVDISRGIIGTEHEAYRYLSSADKATKRAAKLTQQLLTFSKGGVPIFEVSSVYDIVQESADFTLTGSNIACRIDRDTELWATECDKGQIGQVVQNIVLNARQGMPEGGTIHVLCENYVKQANVQSENPLAAGNYIRIRIADEGVGIHADLIEKIFDPYFTTKQEGSGLGMAITHSIITKHQGYIKCESTPGEGATFTFYLPATSKSAEDNNQADVTHKGSGKILVMDDEEPVREVTQSILEYMGYEVLLAKDGEEAIEIYRQCMLESNPVNAVIMDMTIPGGMGGKETMQALLDIDPQVKGVVSSGYSNDPVLANYSDYGFAGFLLKPYMKADLAAALSNALITPQNPTEQE